MWWMLWGDTEEQEESPSPRGLASGWGREPEHKAIATGRRPQLGAGVPKEAPIPCLEIQVAFLEELGLSRPEPLDTDRHMQQQQVRGEGPGTLPLGWRWQPE